MSHGSSPLDGNTPIQSTTYSFALSDFQPLYRGLVSQLGANLNIHVPFQERVDYKFACQQMGVQLEPQNEDIIKNCWIVAHSKFSSLPLCSSHPSLFSSCMRVHICYALLSSARHFHGILVLAWSKLQTSEQCHPDLVACSRMIMGKTDVRWRQSDEEMAQLEQGDPYKNSRYLSVPAAEYIDRALASNHESLRDPTLVPYVGDEPPESYFQFAPHFIKRMGEVYKYMLRTYVHLYTCHIDMLPTLYSDFHAPQPINGFAQPLDKFHFYMLYLYELGLMYNLLAPNQIDAEAVGAQFHHYLVTQREFQQHVDQNNHNNNHNQQQNHNQYNNNHNQGELSLSLSTNGGGADGYGISTTSASNSSSGNISYNNADPRPSIGGPIPAGIDPQLVYARRAELIRKGTPAAIAHSLAISAIEKEMKEGKNTGGHEQFGHSSLELEAAGHKSKKEKKEKKEKKVSSKALHRRSLYVYGIVLII